MIGAKLRETCLTNDLTDWSIRSNKYVQEKIRNMEYHLSKEYDGGRLAKHASASFLNNYKS